MESPRATDQFNAPQHQIDKYKKVIDLIYSNKVNRRNAFECRITEEVKQVFEAYSSVDNPDGEFLWQRYSTGIDSFAKVYALCVDALHNDTYKILGGINRVDQVEENQEDDDDEDHDGPEKRKKKVYRGTSTLEQNPDAFLQKKFDTSNAFDPYFKKISSCFDAASIQGLLTSSLSVNRNLELHLGSGNSCPPDSPLRGQQAQFAFSNYDISDFTRISRVPIFSELQAFERNTMRGPDNTQAVEQMLGYLEGELGLVDDNMSVDSLQDEPIEEDLDIAEVAGNLLKRETDFLGFNQNKYSAELLDKLNSISSDDYYFFKHSKVSNWAGFDYWDRKNMGTAQREKRTARKKEKEHFKFDPSATIQQFEKPKRGFPNTISDAKLKQWNEDDHSIPKDYFFSVQRLTQLFCRPHTYIKKYQNTVTDFSNVLVENDNNEYESDQDALFAIEEFPQITQPNQLNYAKISKALDIKLVKDTIWNQIEHGDKENNQVQVSEKQTFMGLLDKLPGMLPVQQMETLSVHSTFITMLHLANEHNLEFRQYGECDFGIITDQQYQLYPLFNACSNYRQIAFKLLFYCNHLNICKALIESEIIIKVPLTSLCILQSVDVISSKIHQTLLYIKFWQLQQYIQ